MGIALLESKYRLPAHRRAAVARPRLTERLNAASGSPLTVLDQKGKKQKYVVYAREGYVAPKPGID